MIVRIVRMHFREEGVAEFLSLFAEKKQLIRAAHGCTHLELWQDAKDKNVFFTYSKWDSETHLDHYRFSALFKEIWPRTKALFADKAQAWSVEPREVVEDVF